MEGLGCGKDSMVSLNGFSKDSSAVGGSFKQLRYLLAHEEDEAGATEEEGTEADVFSADKEGSWFGEVHVLVQESGNDGDDDDGDETSFVSQPVSLLIPLPEPPREFFGVELLRDEENDNFISFLLSLSATSANKQHTSEQHSSFLQQLVSVCVSSDTNQRR